MSVVECFFGRNGRHACVNRINYILQFKAIELETRSGRFDGSTNLPLTYSL